MFDYYSILNNAPDAFFLGNYMGEFIWCNKKAELLTGYSREELRKLEMKHLFAEKELKQKPLRYDALDQGEVVITRREIKRKDGTVLPIEMHSCKNPDGTYQSVIRDITERVKVEQALRVSEKKYRELFEKSNDAVLIIENNMFVDCNEATVQMLGYKSKKELLDTHPAMLSPEKQPDGRLSYEKAEEMMQIALNKGWHRFEWNHKRADGTAFPVEVLLTAIEYSEQKRVLYTVWRDITVRKQAELYQKIQYEFIKQLISAKSLNEIYTISFLELQKIIDFSGGIIVNVEKNDVTIGFRYALTRKQAMQTCMKLKKKIPTLVTNPKIQLLTIHEESGVNGTLLLIAPLIRDQQVVAFWVAYDVQKQRLEPALFNLLESAMNQLQTAVYHHIDQEYLFQSEERFRTIFEESPIGVFYFNKDGEITECNKKFAEIIGSSRERLIGFKMIQQLKDVKLQLAVKESLSGEYSFYEDWYESVTAKKKSYVRVHLKGIKNKEGQIFAGLGMVEDATATKLLEEQLSQSQKMEAVGKLAGGIAHDFNNILTIINGYTEMLLLDPNLDRKTKHKIQQINQAGEHAASLTSQLLAFSRKQVIQPIVMDCLNSISQLETMIKRLLGEDIILKLQIPSDPLLIKIDPGQFKQILVNLIINARDAMPQGGILTITAGESSVTTHFLELHPEFDASACVWISIEDNGEGIDEEIIHHIFEPFFTTKGVGKGTGLGLAMVYGIMKQAQGIIDVNSKKQSGTKFTLYFPKMEEKLAKEHITGDESDLLSGVETILVVEDEDLLRNMVSELLTDFGYHVITACDGEDGLTKFFQYQEEINLVLTDVIMPKMNGKDIAEKILSNFPETKICFMSGYTRDIFSDKGLEYTGLNSIQKPFTGKKLLQFIRSTLDGTP